MSEIRSHSSPDAPAAIGPYSQAVETRGLLFLSGQIALDPATGSLVGDDAASETQQVLDNIQAVLEAAGSGLDSVVKTTIYLADMADFESVNTVYQSRFGASRPARATIQVAALPRGARVEIEAVAVAGRGSGEAG